MKDDNRIGFYAASYAIEAWMKQFGSAPVLEIRHCDYSEPYSIDEGHMYKLENGRFANVYERGCSCYSSDDADVYTFDTFEEADAHWAKNAPGHS